MFLEVLGYSSGEWVETLAHIAKLTIAYLLALPVGWHREREDRSAGLRTFPLVAVAACGFVIIADRVLGAGSPEISKVIEGLITGVGFIGGGAILKQGAQARGTATAASLWATGALGTAVGFGLYDIAVVLSLVTFLGLLIVVPFKGARGGDLPPEALEPQKARQEAD